MNSTWVVLVSEADMYSLVFVFYLFCSDSVKMKVGRQFFSIHCIDLNSERVPPKKQTSPGGVSRLPDLSETFRGRCLGMGGGGKPSGPFLLRWGPGAPEPWLPGNPRPPRPSVQQQAHRRGGEEKASSLASSPAKPERRHSQAQSAQRRGAKPLLGLSQILIYLFARQGCGRKECRLRGVWVTSLKSIYNFVLGCTEESWEGGKAGCGFRAAKG